MPAPEWVSNGSEPIRGLDLLGLRLPVQDIGVRLLDGITSITPTVRYLSFYAWIADQYRQSGLPNRWADFRRFGAAQEAAIVMANLTHVRTLTGLIGPQVGGGRIDSDDDPLSLEPLVQQLAINIYANASSQLHLTFESPSGIPGVTEERGLPLAQCFGNSIKNTAYAQRLVTDPTINTISRAELAELGSLVAVDNLLPDERDMLIDALIPPDPLPNEIPRLESYAFILFLAAEYGVAPIENHIFLAAHEPPRNLPDIFKRVLDGWLQYMVRDLIAVTHEAVLATVVSEIKILSKSQNGPVRAEMVIRSILENATLQDEALKDLGLLENGETYLDLRFRDLIDRIEAACSNMVSDSNPGLPRWEGFLSESRIYTSALNSGPASMILLPVAWCLAICRTESAIDRQDPAAKFLSVKSWARLGLPDVITPNFKRLKTENSLLPVVIAELVNRTIDQHLRIAWSRASVDMHKNVALLVAEGETWMHLRDYEAGRTLSRLTEATGWLFQLGLTDENGLTDRGETILNRARTFLETHPQ